MAAKSKIVWEGSASLRRLLVPVDDVVPHPDNPRRGDLDVIEESLRHFGQLRPILVNSRSGYIVAGNHTFRAAAERLGWNRIARVVADLDPEQERRYLLMDNRSADVGGYDQEALSAVLTDLAGSGDLAGTGYSEADVAKMLADHEKAAERAREAGSDGGDGGGDGEGQRPPNTAARHFDLALDPKKYEKFNRYLSMLSRELGTDGPSETVYKVVEQAAKNL